MGTLGRQLPWSSQFCHVIHPSAPDIHAFPHRAGHDNGGHCLEGHELFHTAHSTDPNQGSLWLERPNRVIPVQKLAARLVLQASSATCTEAALRCQVYTAKANKPHLCLIVVYSVGSLGLRSRAPGLCHLHFCIGDQPFCRTQMRLSLAEMAVAAAGGG